MSNLHERQAGGALSLITIPPVVDGTDRKHAAAVRTGTPDRDAMTALLAEPAYMPAGRQTVTCGYFEAALSPVATITPGAEIVIDTINGHRHELPDDPRFDVLPDHHAIVSEIPRWPGGHLITGPVAVAGAKSGDLLVVDVLEIELRQNWGYTVIEPLAGTLPEDYPDYQIHHISIDRYRNEACLPWGGRLGLRPFFGIMAVAPPPSWGRISSVIPRAHGGNMDCKELVAGTTVYFPVFNDGALFSVGDGHAAQGDGEVCVTAIETALTGRFRLDLRRDREVVRPRAETSTHLITMGFDEDLDQAVKQALRDMILWLGEDCDLKRADAYALCSLAADMRVTQTVNVAKGIHCMLPKAALAR